MDLKDKIKVMQHFADGGSIEFQTSHDGLWHKSTYPTWDWQNYTYRIAQSPIASDGHNPENITIAQLEPHLGWRFLKPEEIKERKMVPGNKLQFWLGDRWSPGSYAQGNEATSTYRTKLTPAELAEYNIKTKQPLTAPIFPPGTIIRDKYLPNDWRQVNCVTETGFWAFPWKEGQPFNSDTLMNSFEYSTDGGKTWLPFYKEV